MYTKKTKEQIFKENGNIRLVEFTIKSENVSSDFICDESGKIFRKMKTGYWKEVTNKSNHSKGYNVILVNKKQYTRARLILYGIKKINLYDKSVIINHINNDKLDCNINNLAIKPTKENP